MYPVYVIFPDYSIEKSFCHYQTTVLYSKRYNNKPIYNGGRMTVFYRISHYSTSNLSRCYYIWFCNGLLYIQNLTISLLSFYFLCISSPFFLKTTFLFLLSQLFFRIMFLLQVTCLPK